MNIFELVTFLAAVGVGYYCGKFLSSFWGILGWICGIPLGFLLVVFILFTLDRLIPKSEWLPVCRQGKCSESDYRHIEHTEKGDYFICACGKKYLEADNRFMEVLDDGSTRPYMIRCKRGGPWEADTTDGNSEQLP